MKEREVDAVMEQIRSELRQKRPQQRETVARRPSVEEVLARARAELARRHRPEGAAGVSADVAGATGGPWHPATERLPGKRDYVLAELLKFGDADFIDVAYRVILRRPPDPAGLEHYLAGLRSGALTKVEILGQIRWSDEGRARSVHVDGLLVPYTLQRWHRKRYLGPLVSWLHSFVKLGTLVERQAAHDAALAREAQEVGRALNQVTAQLQERIAGFDEQLALYPDRQEIAALEASISAVRETHADAVGSFNSKLDALRAQLDAHQATGEESAVAQAERLEFLQHKLHKTEALVEAMVARERQAQDSARALDQFYADFEDRFRGDRQLVRERSEPYLQWVRDAGVGTQDAPVLDVGCGRGEWLELLRHSGMYARGIDLNRVFVDSCRSMGLAVSEQDAIEGMRALPAGSVGAVTSMHLVEHLPFETMIAFVDEARRVLKPGGLLALETPNPENLNVAALFFYYDPTHRNPLPPEMMRWIVESRGFEDVRIERLTHAREIQAPALLSEDVPGAASMNVLIGSLGAAPDYAIVARRP